MKRKAITLFLLMFCFVSKAEQEMHLEWDSGLPLQAAVCDIVGIGKVVSLNNATSIVEIAQFWTESLSTNIVAVEMLVDDAFPTNNASFVFFLSRYSTFANLEPIECRFSYIFDMEHHTKQNEPEKTPFLLNGNRSWFPVTTENEAMVIWSSNLVHAAQVTINRQAFYELIRDGYRLHPENSRIHRDSEYTFMYFGLFMSTDFMSQIWTDIKLLGRARSWVNMSYQQKTQTWLPRLNAVPAPPEGGEP